MFTKSHVGSRVVCRICGKPWLWGMANEENKDKFICPDCDLQYKNAMIALNNTLAEAEDKGVLIVGAKFNLNYLAKFIKTLKE